jgi:redox-sensing transcriptional repressor
LGTALANYNGFGRSNFTVVSLFDNDEQKIGRPIGEKKILVQNVQELQKIIRDQSIDVMVIAVPARAAQKVLNQIMSAGIKAVLNFAPASLNSRRGVKVKTVDLTTSLESLSYFLAQPEAGVITSSRRRSQSTDIDESKERQL